jgi:Zn-dependent M28 family amino/carboxypeptidase
VWSCSTIGRLRCSRPRDSIRRAFEPPIDRRRGRARTSHRADLARRVLQRGDAPNLVAALDGSDPQLAGEYVAISAHLDHIGMRAGPGDSIYNGADDNASGVAGLLELAEAFAGGEPDARPEHRRSLLFVVPSGEEKGLWGSDYFTRYPTVPLDRIVADLNMDLIGRNWSDSIIVVGPELSTLGATLTATVAATPSSG